MKRLLAAFAFSVLGAVELLAGDAIVIEKLSFQFDEYGGARAIGVLKNNSGDLIAIPTLEITFATKEKPNVSVLQQLDLSASLKGGESRAFHSGVFNLTGEVAAKRVLEIKSSRIHPGSMHPASASWNLRLAGRENVLCDTPVLTFENGHWRGLKGNLVAPTGSKIKSAEFTASYFDGKGELVDVQTFSVQRRDGNCIDSFPYPFETGGGLDELKIDRVSVRCLCDRITTCQ